MDWALATLIAAVFSMSTNGYAAFMVWRNRALLQWKWIDLAQYVYISCLSLFYVVQLGRLRWTDVDRADWSKQLLPYSFIVFLMVWAMPGVIKSIKIMTYREIAEELEQRG